ncbi:MAG TPA: NUDIX domain-containing protein [Candidatus Limnocylindrales bacterium]|nr:NUDIX domain-containing protein [Candidatus Limnocylindrales bacterium]
MPPDSVLRDGDLVFEDGESIVRGGPVDRARITRLAAYGVLIADGRILLCRVGPGNLGEGRWTLPGGGLEFGEAPDAGAIREVEEETGLVAEITGPPVIHSDAGVWERRNGTVSYHHVRFVYRMRVVGGEARLEVDGSTDAFDWVPMAAVAGLPLGDLVLRTLEGLVEPEP